MSEHDGPELCVKCKQPTPIIQYNNGLSCWAACAECGHEQRVDLSGKRSYDLFPLMRAEPERDINVTIVDGPQRPRPYRPIIEIHNQEDIATELGLRGRAFGGGEFGYPEDE